MFLLFTYLLIALAFSFLCSMLEAVLLSVSPSHVAVLVERGTATGKRLQRMKQHIDRPLAAILTLNTFAHTLGAAGVGAEAALLWGDAWVGLVSFIVTLLILVFSEIIPKTLGAVHAKRLAPFAAWTIHYLIIILKPAVAACNRVSLFVSGSKQSVPKLSRDEIRSIAQMAREEGVLDPNEAMILRNLIALREVTIQSIMTPRTVVFTLQAEETVEQATRLHPPPFSRIPIVGNGLDDPRGVIHRRELYKALADGHAQTALGELARPLHAVPEVVSLPVVLKQFIERREHLFLAVDEYGGSVGIVTLEDVVEALLGVEIVDETDDVEDMQALAKEALDKLRHRDVKRG